MSFRVLPPDDRLVPADDAAERVARDRRTLFRWIDDGFLTPYKKRGDRRMHIDLAELPEAMRRAGRQGPKPASRRPGGGKWARRLKARPKRSQSTRWPDAFW